MSCKYEKIGLYSHNMRSYDLIKNSFDMGENIVGIVHATGTGKSYNALQLAYDNKDKKIIYVVPSAGIIEHIKKIVEDNSNLDLVRDFSNLDFRTYQSFISLSENEIYDINCDLLILDEFHHIGAPVWGARINTMIETHPDMKIFGMTAYTVRDRGTAYERDMADPETDELFSGKVISRYDICDAMIDGVLPKPVYKSAYTNLIGLESQLEEKVQKLGATTKEYQEYMAILNDVKRKIHEAPSIPNILKKSIKQAGKYIYFCPPCSEEGSNDIETIKQQAIEWFREFIPEEDIIIYTSTSDMGEDGKKNRDAFYNDVNLDGKPVDNKLRVMFAINQYNEGIHAPNIDGVIMGRGTTSDIVYFEQLGRALSVRGNTKDEFDELEQYSIEQLISMCKDKDISIKDNISKEELIEKLIAPLVIDLTNNYAFIKELENNLKDRIKYIQENDRVNHRDIKIKDASFDIEIENQDLFEMLRYVMDRLTMTWEDKYILAKAYYEHYGNLDIIQVFKTLNGYEYDENGISLGDWISKQRKAYQGKNGIISEEQIKLLKDIGMNFANIHDSKWMSTYELAKAYYEHYGNLDMKKRFKTLNGYEYDEKGIRLGEWILNQRRAYQKGKLTENQIKLLEDIEMNFGNVLDSRWMSTYELAKTYYEHHGNLDMLASFKTINGYEYDEKGISLGNWISRQRIAYQKGKFTEKQIKLLEDIEMNFGNVLDSRWMSNYELAKTYYEHHGNLVVPKKFKTLNGYEYDENGIKLAIWILRQRRAYQGKYGIITKEQIKLLEDIKMNFDNVLDSKWMSNYELAKAYYEHHGNLDMLASFKTINGYEYDENGIRLGDWILYQRRAYQGKNGIITEEQIKLLEDIKMNFDNILDSKWMSNYELAKTYYEHHGNLDVIASFKTINGYEYDEKGISLGYWISKQRIAYQKGKLTEEQIKLLEDIKMNFGNILDSRWMSTYKLAKTYYEHHGNLGMIASFKTINGYEYDEKGISLGNWIFRQRRAYRGKNGIITEEQIKLLEDINIKWFSDGANIKLQQEIIDSKNVERKCKEILNRFYSILNNFSDDSLPSNEELNQKFIYELDSHIKLKKLTNI